MSNANLFEPFIWYDQSDNWKNIFISYYYIDPNDPKKKIWTRAPFDNDFVIIDPYTEHDFISRHITTQEKGNMLFKLSFLRKISVSKFSKSSLLIALLWVKTDNDNVSNLYENQILKTQHEFYRCNDTSGSSYLLIPLYAKMGYRSKKNPVLLYHSNSIKNALLLSITDIYQNLVDMFENFVNAFPVIMNNRRRFIVQFNEYPAQFVFKDINGMWW